MVIVEEMLTNLFNLWFYRCKDKKKKKKTKPVRTRMCDNHELSPSAVRADDVISVVA